MQYGRRIFQLQLPTANPPHHLHSLQLTSTHSCPLQPDLLGWRSQFKGTSLKSFEGDIIKEFQQERSGVGCQLSGKSKARPPQDPDTRDQLDNEFVECNTPAKYSFAVSEGE